MDTKTLIDKAKGDVLSDQELADELKFKREYLSLWRASNQCPAWGLVLLAQKAGLDPRTVVLEAAVRKEKDPKKKETLKRALQLGGAEISYLAGTALALIAAISLKPLWIGLVTMYIMSNSIWGAGMSTMPVHIA